MELKLIKSTWGLSGTLESNVEKIVKAGYCGIEAPLPPVENAREFMRTLKAYDLDYIAMIFTSDDHVSSFKTELKRAALLDPLFVVSHSAKDSLPFDKQIDFFGRALEIEKKIGIHVAHETHRGRAMFTPWNTAALLKSFEELKINADFSHWCCVCESLLEDQEENLDIACKRTIHIHGRVGYTEGPQVSDPGAPENYEALKVHEIWWDRICEYRKEQGAEFITFTPEFGPPPYLQTLPYTNQPVADLWNVCLWMAKRFESRFKYEPMKNVINK